MSGTGGSWTHDPTVFSRVLSQLSYSPLSHKKRKSPLLLGIFKTYLLKKLCKRVFSSYFNDNEGFRPRKWRLGRLLLLFPLLGAKHSNIRLCLRYGVAPAALAVSSIPIWISVTLDISRISKFPLHIAMQFPSDPASYSHIGCVVSVQALSLAGYPIIGLATSVRYLQFLNNQFPFEKGVDCQGTLVPYGVGGPSSELVFVIFSKIVLLTL